MDALIKQRIREAEAGVKSSVSWQPDVASPQDVYTFDPSGVPAKDGPFWNKINLDAPTHADSSDTEIDKIRLLSWNIDFMLPHAHSRMMAALNHLYSICEGTSPTPSDTALVIFLAECVRGDLRTISEHPWIRRRFLMTDIDTSHWHNGYYGTTTLIDKRLVIQSCFRVHFDKTRMQRDGLFVDVRFGHPAKIVRLCNTHLESLALEPPFRPAQMQTCASFMKRDGLTAAVLAGDLNAIQDFDKTLHTDNGLCDAYLELGGDQEDVQGHTWGQQALTALRQQFGTSRMDKVYFCGAIRAQSFSRFGAGIQVADVQEREDIVRLGFDEPWITDHLGVMATFQFNVLNDAMKL